MMTWPIPKIPVKTVLSRLDYKRWIIILLLMLLAGVLLAVFPGKVTSSGQALLYGALPAILLWFCIFGMVFYRYERSVNAVLLWNAETERTKQLWRRWSKKQRRVVGNVILTPEDNGVDLLLGKSEEIPAYPEKARSLFADLPGLNRRLTFIDQETEKNYPGYRHHLSEIVIQHSDRHLKEIIAQAVYRQWDLYPKFSSKVESFCADDESEQFSLVLFVCLQDWAGRQTEKYSEFMTAQLIASHDFASKNDVPVIAGVGRSLSADSLSDALDMLSEYNQLEKDLVRYIWLSGVDADQQGQLTQYLATRQWLVPDKKPFILLDHTFGPPGPLMFPVAVSLLVDAAKHSGKMQLLISRQQENKYSLCLITRELFL